MSYCDTFILVAEDCPTNVARSPGTSGKAKSIALIEYALLSKAPYTYTQEELQFAVYVERSGIAPKELKLRRSVLWKEFFSTSRACLRSSALAKRYGWGFHFDEDGRIALVPVESTEYKRRSNDESNLKLLKALRNKRAKP